MAEPIVLLAKPLIPVVEEVIAKNRVSVTATSPAKGPVVTLAVTELYIVPGRDA